MDALALFLPRFCAGCGVIGTALCPRCASRLVRVGPTGCARCGAPGPWPVARCAECSGRRLGFATARAAIAYDDRSRPLVSAWKEGGRRDLARPFADLVDATVPRPSAELLVPVPGDRERGLVRGHVPAESLCRALGKRWSIAVGLALRRAPGAGGAPARRQAALTLAERRANVRDAFQPRAAVRGRVVLVDDVYTTGATASACATALRHAGAERVDVVSLARAVR